MSDVRVAVSCGCALGEGALWDHRTRVFYWVDILAPALWRLDASGEVDRLDVPERIGFVALTPSRNVLLAGLKSGLALLDLRTGEVRPLVSPEPDIGRNRINDGTVAPDGTVYFGTMDDSESEPTGTFWRWDGDRLERFGPNVIVSNGPALSPDGQKLYYVDTVGGVIFVHDLSARKPDHGLVFVRFREGWGNPDGLCVDAQGCVWACHWGGSRITRFRRDGAVDRVLELPTANITKCAFGGANLDTLFITSASKGRDRASDPQAGHVFTVRLGIYGVPASIARVPLPGRPAVFATGRRG